MQTCLHQGAFVRRILSRACRESPQPLAGCQCYIVPGSGKTELDQTGYYCLMPTLILICGLPGAGKTTLAKRLESERGAVRQCPDDRIWEIVKRTNDPALLENLRDPVERQMTQEAGEFLLQGKDVILEYGFWSKEERLAMIKLAHQHGAKVELRVLDPELSVICQRVAARNIKLPEGSFMVSMKQLHEYDKMFARPDQDEQNLYDRYHISIT